MRRIDGYLPHRRLSATSLAVCRIDGCLQHRRFIAASLAGCRIDGCLQHRRQSASSTAVCSINGCLQHRRLVATSTAICHIDGYLQHRLLSSPLLAGCHIDGCLPHLRLSAASSAVSLIDCCLSHSPFPPFILPIGCLPHRRLSAASPAVCRIVGCLMHRRLRLGCLPHRRLSASSTAVCRIVGCLPHRLLSVASSAVCRIAGCSVCRIYGCLQSSVPGRRPPFSPFWQTQYGPARLQHGYILALRVQVLLALDRPPRHQATSSHSLKFFIAPSWSSVRRPPSSAFRLTHNMGLPASNTTTSLPYKFKSRVRATTMTPWPGDVQSLLQVSLHPTGARSGARRLLYYGRLTIWACQPQARPHPCLTNSSPSSLRQPEATTPPCDV